MVDPSMFPASKIHRAVELNAPFLQCDKMFHVLSIPELKCKSNLNCRVIAEFVKFVILIRHDQQHLSKFCLGLIQDWYFAIEN